MFLILQDGMLGSTAARVQELKQLYISNHSHAPG